jgi:NhaP-type Na+/H+ or K+/H+ antiporter
MGVGAVRIWAAVFSPLPIKDAATNATIIDNVFETAVSAFCELTKFIRNVVHFLGVGIEISCNVESENPAIAIRIMV